MATATYTATGTKATSPAKLDKSIFGITEVNNELIKGAYTAYLANGRINLAQSKNRGDVRGGGRKPWRQKGTGRARFGSSRNPIWRGGGVAFGPTGAENYSHKLPTQTKRMAICHALSLKAESIIVIESFAVKDGKTSTANKLLQKINARGNTLVVVENISDLVKRATSNLDNVAVIQPKYINVFDLMNADSVVVEAKALPVIKEWLGGTA